MTSHPDLVQLFIDFLPSRLPLLHLTELLAQFLDLLLDTILLTRGSDSVELVFVGILAETECECVRVIPLERSAGRDSDECCVLIS